jgi:hypothetical protein
VAEEDGVVAGDEEEVDTTRIDLVTVAGVAEVEV